MKNNFFERVVTDLSDLSRCDVLSLKKIYQIKEKSTAVKRKVGAIISYNDDNFIHRDTYFYTEGFNHMFKDLSISSCEDKNGESFLAVVHAEEMAIVKFLKISKGIHSTCFGNITLYVTFSPCINCAKLLVHSGIKNLVYVEKHAVNFHEGLMSPLQLLVESGISVTRIDMDLYNEIIGE